MEEAIKCDFCSQEFHSLYKLNVHVERHHNRVCDIKKTNTKCNVCGKEYSSEKDLIRHMRTDTGKRTFKCQVGGCGMAFMRESTLKDHNKFKHSDERPFKCDFPGCVHTTKTISDLKKHKIFHSDERPFACTHSGCNFRAKRKHHIPPHVANVHSESQTLTCSKCNYSTHIAKNLSRHMFIHEGKNKSIPCSIYGCKYKGKNSETLKKHMLRHKTLLPCPVSGCGQYLATKDALKKHLKLHNPSGRAFQCPLCFKHFPTLFKLQRHCGVHTNEKPFQCGHCKYEAVTRSFVKLHISSVHAAIEFPFVVHLLNDRECLRCKVALPSGEFVVHCKNHVDSAVINERFD